MQHLVKEGLVYMCEMDRSTILCEIFVFKEYNFNSR